MAVTEIELAEAMAGALKGDQRAYRRLLALLTDHLRGQIQRIQYRLGGKTLVDADDVLQETLIAIHKRLHTYDSRYRVTAWVNAIAKHKIIDLYRASGSRQGHVNIDEIAELIADEVEPQPAAAQDVARMLSGLPANLRKPIEDVKLMGLSIAEAAEKNGMSESAVKIGIHRGMKRLAATFGIIKPA